MQRFESKKIEPTKSYFKIKLLILSVIFLIICLLYFYLAFLKDNLLEEKETNQDYEFKKEYIYFSNLNGFGVDEEIEKTPQVVAVILDNHFQARPHLGLDKAVVVYEVPVEGNITRLLALFNSKEGVENIGPIRSARPYFLDWINEYGEVVYLHCGGSPEALENLKTTKHFDINEFYWGNYFWRSKQKSAPHNIYTSSTLWQKIIENKNYNNKEDWQGWIFDDYFAEENYEEIRELSLTYSNYYKVSWKFNEFIGMFEYYHNDNIYKTADDNNILSDNVLIQYVQTEIIDDYGRLKIKTIGSGEARILRDGKILRGEWKKDDANARTRFFEKNGGEVKLKPGNTWVMIVPTTVNVSVVN